MKAKYSFVIETINKTSSVMLNIETRIGCNEINMKLNICDADRKLCEIVEHLEKIFSEGFTFIDNNGLYKFRSEQKNKKISINNDCIRVGNSLLDGIYIKTGNTDGKIFDAIDEFESLYGS